MSQNNHNNKNNGKNNKSSGWKGMLSLVAWALVLTVIFSYAGAHLQQDMETAQEATEEQLAVFRTYMSFDEEGLVIGKTGNPFTFRVVNDRLAFYMNDTEVAYLSNNKLYVTQAEILSKLIIGKFAFEPQTNGNLSLIFNG